MKINQALSFFKPPGGRPLVRPHRPLFWSQNGPTWAARFTEMKFINKVYILLTVRLAISRKAIIQDPYYS